MVPSLREPIAGCAFATRCPYAIDRCRAEAPPLEADASGHWVACWLADRLPREGAGPLSESRGPIVMPGPITP